LIGDVFTKLGFLSVMPTEMPLVEEFTLLSRLEQGRCARDEGKKRFAAD